ncbi:MAG: hypothetical protein EZS28_048524, partial [Streblomastix strix]
MISQLEVRKTEQVDMDNSLIIIEQQAQEQSLDLITKFNKLKKSITQQVELALQDGGGQGQDGGGNYVALQPEAIKEFSDANEALLADLLDVEEHRVEQSEAIIEQYSSKLKEIFSITKDRIQLDFQNLIKLEMREAELMATDSLREAERATAPPVGIA